jgi:protein-disulfide isomerase
MCTKDPAQAGFFFGKRAAEATMSTGMWMVVWALTTQAPIPAKSDDDVMRMRVQQLEEQMQALQKRVGELEQRPRTIPRPEPAPQTEAYQLPAGTSAVLGSSTATIDLVIFFDYQCPFCRRVFPVMQQVATDPELAAKVRVVFKHFPLGFHQEARAAAKAAMAARDLGGDKAFWAMSAKLFSDQTRLGPDAYKQYAREIGLNTKKFAQALQDNDTKYEAELTADTKLGTEAAKVRGTPSLFVGGWELRDRSVAGVKALIIDKKLADLGG